MIRLQRRYATIALIALATLCLLVLALPSLSSRVERHEEIRGLTESLQASESRFRELVITLRHGVTANYDEANALMHAIAANQAALASRVEDLAPLQVESKAYGASVADRQEHWEDFKRHNAVVRNSLRYLQTDMPVFIGDVHRTAHESFMHEALSGLNVDLYLQALGDSDRGKEIRERISRIHAMISSYPAPVREEYRLLEKHVGVILDHAPALSREMAVLAHGEARVRLTRLTEKNHGLLLTEQARASWYRRGLFIGVALLLVGLAVMMVRYLDSLRRLSEQGDFLKSVTDNVGVGVMALDARDRVVFANPQMEQLLGYASGGLIGVDLCASGVHVGPLGDVRPIEDCRAQAALARGEGLHGVENVRCRDGEIVTVEVNAAPWRMNDAQGSVLVIQDIRRRLSEEKDLRLAGTVFESSQQGIIITDAQGTILRVNPAYCRMTGYPAEELIGRNPRILRSGAQDKQFYSAMWAELILNGRWQGELLNRRKSGESYIQWANIDAVRTEQGDLLYVGITSDISELVYARERLAHLAYYDTLTGLPNRVLLQDRLNQALALARRDGGHFALILADLDNFKTVNDTLGHAAGDDLLVEVAHRLKSAVREADTVARIGGDEFALVLTRIHEPEAAAKVAAHLVASLGQPYRIKDLEIAGGASLGVTFWPNDGETADVLLKHADVAMYRAKARGRNNYQFFTSDMAEGAVEAMRIESGLRHAIEDGELAMHYQPQIAPDGRAVSAEALMRWNSKELGWVPPSRFIPIAEHTGLIGQLGDYALWQACRQCVRWRERLAPDFRVAVNLSAAQFRHEGLVEHVAKVLHEFNLPGSALELEITESVVMEDVSRGQAVLSGLKRLGCKIAIDDFGTGYSSLAYLRRFPVDVLKIDKSFVDGLGGHSDDASVAEAIVGLARSLNLDVVAEGVESAAQIDALKRIAGDLGYLAQGYFYSPPVSAAEFEQRFPAFRQLKLVGDRA